MKIKELIKQDEGFRYVADSMEFRSSAGRRCMLESAYLTTAAGLEAEWDRTEAVMAAIRADGHQGAYKALQQSLMQMHDLQGTVAALAERRVLNEVDLFEIKNLAALNQKARAALAELGLDGTLPLPDLAEVFALLDPDGTGTVSFYIYDSYDPRLAPLRQQLRSLPKDDGQAGRSAELFAEQERIEQEVCTRLATRLQARADAIGRSLEQMAYTDFLLAKTGLALQWGLTRPAIGDTIAYGQLFNPRLRHRNESLGLRYQAVDIAAPAGATLITGANMAGKTVLLKSLATAQLMIQCGLYAPAASASVPLFERVETSIGDGQNEMNGLSSYASEIIRISQILQLGRRQRALILIDEPARTTNPVEGKAIVESLVGILMRQSSTSLITTHYSGIGKGCRKLRVRGFVEGLSTAQITPSTINQFIDYSLVEDHGDAVPREALRIADILGCDAELIALANEEYQQTKHLQQ